MGWALMASDTKVQFDVLANDKASTKLDKIAHAADSMAEKFKGAGAKASQGLSKLGGGISKVLGGLGKAAGPALGAGLTAGAVFIGGLTQAMDVEDANAKLQAGLGLTATQSQKAGKIAGDLYKNAYGDSVGEVSDTLSTVFQSGITNINASADAIKGVTAQVMNYSKISGEEALPVTRAVSQMLKTGLAKNATEAFDILTRGQQLGINKSEDLLDTFNEYGTQFRKLGLEGPMALGLMNQALKAGARDSDIAADALKEFAIRSVDGSKTTVDGFKSLKLNAKAMQEQMSSGGPKAAAGLDAVLDRLRAVKDPAERSRIAVELFGTQAEDLGSALYAIDPSTAVAGLGKLKGAAEDAGDALNGTASNKIATIGRTIKMSIVDAIGKYALPKLEQFSDWFTGPGKLVIASWAITSGGAVLDLADNLLGAVGSMLGGLAKFGRVAMISAAGVVALSNPGMALDMLKNADALGKWADTAATGIEDARTHLKGWKDQLDKTNTKVKLEATITDLDAKIGKAQKELKDPDLTKERRAKLTATIAELQTKKQQATGILTDPKLVATRTAKLTADKTALETKLRQAKASLNDPKLTPTKRAKITADITALQHQINAAQTKINSLRGKTVQITTKLTYTGGALTGQKSDPTLGGLVPRAGGGPVKKGQAYWVGEEGPEPFIPDQDGRIMSTQAAHGAGMTPGSPVMGASGAATILFGSDGSRIGDAILWLVRQAVQQQYGGNVNAAFGGK